MINMTKKLSHPYNYYWERFSEGKCPFCKADLIATSENKDLVLCHEYNGYLTTQACESYRDPADGRCRECRPNNEGNYYELVKDSGFLCEGCNHGVIFSDPPRMITDKFLHSDDKTCTKCEGHNKAVERTKRKDEAKPGNISDFL